MVGINFMLHWPGTALTLATHPKAELPVGDPRAELLRDRIRESQKVQSFNPPYPILGASLFVADISPWREFGRPAQAIFPVFEQVDQVRPHIEHLKSHPIVITASRWNHDVLADLGVQSCMVHQGYDPVLFNPGVRGQESGGKDGRFHVFSGGKAEHRKGQDLVLEGFQIFAEKHDDAVLHAAWACPWPQLARTFARSRLGVPPGAWIGRPNFAAWAQRAGIKRHQFEFVPQTPNHLMPRVLAGMDCAVFASRLEGGTNIAAMEAIGCGIPTILSPGTGHDDLDVCWKLDANTPENIASGLEGIYDRGIVAMGVDRHLADFAWPARIAELVEVLKDV